MKNKVRILLTIVMVLALVGCGKNNTEENKEGTRNARGVMEEYIAAIEAQDKDQAAACYDAKQLTEDQQAVFEGECGEYTSLDSKDMTITNQEVSEEVDGYVIAMTYMEYVLKSGARMPIYRMDTMAVKDGTYTLVDGNKATGEDFDKIRQELRSSETYKQYQENANKFYEENPEVMDELVTGEIDS